MTMKMRLNKKTKLTQKEKSRCNGENKEIAQLKAAYKNGSLKFDSKDIAGAILEDKDIRRGLTK